jgi:hypothetical protein
MFMLTVLALPPAIDAATPYEDEVPIELARYFLPGNWYSDLPPGLPPLTIPEGMELVGSQDQIQRKQVLFRTSMGAGEAQQIMAQAILSEAGWLRLDDSINRVVPSGFVASDNETPLPAVRLCHDNVSMLAITGRANGFVHLDFYTGVGNCSQSSINNMRANASRSELLEYVPVLELPDNSNPITPPRLIDEMSGQQFVYDTGVRITADSSLRRLANGFARQMRRQGWRRREAWRGDVTAGNNWTRELQDGIRLSASIDIVRMADNDYAVRLHVAEVVQDE